MLLLLFWKKEMQKSVFKQSGEVRKTLHQGIREESKA